MFYWLAVTADRFELPIAVAESASELAAMLGVTKGTVVAMEHRRRSGKASGRKIIKIKGE